jgi:tetratricopeptide (TPR) repeat protein
MRRIAVLTIWMLCGFFVGLPCARAGQGQTGWPHAETEAAEPPPRLFAFAQALLETGEYYRAVGEFQRFLFFQPQHPLASQAQLRIALAYFCGERWLQAFEVFRQVTRVASDPAVREVAALWMAESLARRGTHEDALRLYREVIATYPGTPTAWRGAYLRAWSLLWLRQWAEARQAFATIAETSPYYTSAQRLAAVLAPPPDLPRRSPTVARVLSTVLPGAGQIYSGHVVDGLIGLGVHSALIAGTSGAILAGLEGAGGIGAFFTWGFYRAQMGNAAASARAFNVQAEERFIGQLAAQERRFLQAYLVPVPCAS